MLFLIFSTLLAQVLADINSGSLPISVNFKPLKGGLTLVARDRSRFQAMFPTRRHEKRVDSVELKSTGVQYTLTVGFGSPPKYCELAIDTGSAYTWVSKTKYAQTSTSIRQGNQRFEIEYARGSAQGSHYKDLVTLSSSLTIDNLPFGVASAHSRMTTGVHGIIGLGRTTLNNDVVTPNEGGPVPSVMDTLFAQGKIRHNVFGLSFTPHTFRGTLNGELTFGMTDRRKYTGELNWVSITNREHWNKSWAFEQIIKYENDILQSSSTGLIDSGSTLIYISSPAFQTYSKSLPDSKVDRSTGLLEIPQKSLGKMKSLFFVISGVSYELTPDAQLWPRTLNTALGGKANRYYSVINSLDNTEVNTGSSFIIGYVFMQRFYTAYDASNSRIGFATTSSTRAIVNGSPSTLTT